MRASHRSHGPVCINLSGPCKLPNKHAQAAVPRSPVLHQRVSQLARPRRLTTPQTTRPSARVAGSRVRASLQRRGQLARPHRITTPRPTHQSAPAADSAVIDFSFTVIIIGLTY